MTMLNKTRLAMSCGGALVAIAVAGAALAAGTIHNPTRHRPVRMNGLPAPYDAMVNPYAGDAAAITAGATIYADNCASCHGAEGLGDGEAGAELDPPPPVINPAARLEMRGMGGGMGMGHGMGMMRGGGPAMMMELLTSDGFLMWTVSEGGEALGTGMPAFKDVLSEEERWKLVTYLQDGMPEAK